MTCVLFLGTCVPSFIWKCWTVLSYEVKLKFCDDDNADAKGITITFFSSKNRRANRNDNRKYDMVYNTYEGPSGLKMGRWNKAIGNMMSFFIGE